MSFPIDVSQYKPLELDPSRPALSADELQQLTTNIGIVRDTIVFYTAIAGIKGYAGHTGGAYSIVPEVLIGDGFIRGTDGVYPAFFDEAGHRVAIQYAMAAFNGVIPLEKLYHYREANHGLYGHPERDPEVGVPFASGRLGHLWPFINGVAKANPDKAVLLYGSDGSQMEGDDAEAARLAVAQKLNVKIMVDNNNVTISGHPSEYIPGYDISKTLAGHGLTVDEGDPEKFDELYARMARAMNTAGPIALINNRVMAPGIPALEGSHAGHDVIKKDAAVEYLKGRGQDAAIEFLDSVEKPKTSVSYLGSSDEMGSNRTEFGNIVNGILDNMDEKERIANVLVVDSDLEGSTGLKGIRAKHPEVFINGGVQERGNLSAAAGFGFEEGKQGIFSTFSAFIEMVVSELTMARLNEANLICHFSHAGVDEIADNTCHYGINLFCADTGVIEIDNSRMYFPADALQLKSLVETIWNDEGIRFVFTNRSKLPFILKEDGSQFYGEGYAFQKDKDEVIREGKAGYVISYGEMLCRALDAVERARKEGIDVGLINKPTLNAMDKATLKIAGSTGFVLVVEGQNMRNSLGQRYGTCLLQNGLTPKYDHMGVSKQGAGGLSEHVLHQGLGPDDILARIKKLAG